MAPDRLISHSQHTSNAGQRRLIHAGLVIDGTGRRHAPGALLIEDDRVIAAGSPQSIGAIGETSKRPNVQTSKLSSTLRVGDVPLDVWTFGRLDVLDRVLIPALVNAHAHLDLSHIGPVPYTGDFVSWVDVVRDRRGVAPESIATAVQIGARLSLVGGTAFVGDIAGVGSLAAVEALRESPLRGVSYVELFGQGPPQQHAAAHAIIRAVSEALPHDENGVRIGLQPHAPYSCAKSIYEAAIELGLPLATHLAETLEELEFVHNPHGSALASLLEARGVWHDSISGYGCHPIDALADVLSRTPFIAAHLNYVEDRHIEMLAQWPITVAYCPRASAYFGHPKQTSKSPKVQKSKGGTNRRAAAQHLDVWTFGRLDVSTHRYRDMASAGVNVALGTDSILCLDTPNRISVLDEMRFLYRRDGADPMQLLRMATINGAKALGVDERLVTFDEGPIAGVIALPFDPHDSTDPLAQVLKRDDAPEWVVQP